MSNLSPKKASRPSPSQRGSDPMSSRVQGTSTPAAERYDVSRDQVPARPQDSSARMRSNAIITNSADASSPFISQSGPYYAGPRTLVDARLKQFSGTWTSPYQMNLPPRPSTPSMSTSQRLVQPYVQAIGTPKKRPGLHAQYATRIGLGDSTATQLADMDEMWDIVVESAENHQRAVAEYYGALQCWMASTSSPEVGPVTSAADVMSDTQGAANIVHGPGARHKGQQVQSRQRGPRNRRQSSSKSHEGRDHEGLRTVRGPGRISKPVAPALGRRASRKVRNLRSEDEHSAEEEATARGTKHKIDSNRQEGIESASEGNRKRSRLSLRDPADKKDKDSRHITNTSEDQMSRNKESTRYNREDEATGAENDLETIELDDPASQQGGVGEQVKENEGLRNKDLNDPDEWFGVDFSG